MGKIAILLMVVLCVGCLERKENLTIHRDGSVDVIWDEKGDQDDILSGLGRPEGENWQVEQGSYQKDGEKRYRYLAKASFHDLQSYSREVDFGACDLQIENRLKIENKDGKRYYFFTRLYQGRDWWKFEKAKRNLVDEKLEQRVAKNGIAGLSPKEQEKFLGQLANFEIEKRTMLIGDALGKAMLESPYPVQLIDQARNELRREYGTIITSGKIIDLLELDDQKQGRELTAIEQKLAAMEKRIVAKVFIKYPNIDYQKWIDNRRNDYLLSEDLMDENFKVRIAMPGKVIFTNGQRLGDNEVFWEFKGKYLANRHVPLEVISVTK